MTRLAQLEALATLATQMRVAQRRYYRGRGKDDLIESKRLESQLDTALATLRDSAQETLP